MTRTVKNSMAALAVAALALAGCKNDSKSDKAGSGTAAAGTGTADKGAGPAAAGSAAKPDKPDKPEPPAGPKTKPYRDDEFGFAVESTREPVKGQQEVPTPIGDVTAHTFMFSTDSAPGAILVMVAPKYLDADQVDVAEVLTGAETGAINGVGGSVVESKEIEVDGVAGRVVKFTAEPAGQSAVGQMKMFLRDGALYQVLTVHLESADDFAAESQQFIDSFRFIPIKS